MSTKKLVYWEHMDWGVAGIDSNTEDVLNDAIDAERFWTPIIMDKHNRKRKIKQLINTGTPDQKQQAERIWFHLYGKTK